MSYNINELLSRLEENQDRREKMRDYIEKGGQEKHHKYYQAHRTERLEQYHNDKKQLHYYYENKPSILAKYDRDKATIRNHAYYEENKADILKKRSEDWTCECGSIVRLGGKTEHLKTKRHLKLLRERECIIE